MDAIQLRDIVRRPALDGLSLAVARGSFVALVGASGSGKTTTLKLVNRLIEPDAGQVLIDGAPAAAVPPHELRRRIGYVFQGVGLFPHLSVGENIAVTPKLLGWSSAKIAARVAELIALAGLPADFARRDPATLSGGERQRVGLARALAAAPKLMLMDEPFGALDPQTRDTLGTAYRGLHDELALTTVMVTHDMAEALLLADRIVVLARGRIVADGDPALFASGRAGPEAEALMAAPRRAAQRFAELAG